jgi:hypothetical protein
MKFPATEIYMGKQEIDRKSWLGKLMKNTIWNAYPPDQYFHIVNFFVPSF